MRNLRGTTGWRVCASVLDNTTLTYEKGMAAWKVCKRLNMYRFAMSDNCSTDEMLCVHPTRILQFWYGTTLRRRPGTMARRDGVFLPPHSLRRPFTRILRVRVGDKTRTITAGGGGGQCRPIYLDYLPQYYYTIILPGREDILRPKQRIQQRRGH